nr:hypothetical protein [uncultured Microbacterium sp.]
MSWWRRQHVALIALAAAAVAVVGAYLWLDVLPDVGSRPEVVQGDPTADLSGQRLTLGDAEWDEFDAPEGSRTLSVRVSSSGGGDAAFCGPATLTEHGSARVWLSSRDGLDVPGDLGESSCAMDSSPYRMLLVFLLPDDASGPFDLDIAGGDHDVARFVVEP